MSAPKEGTGVTQGTTAQRKVMLLLLLVVSTLRSPHLAVCGSPKSPHACSHSAWAQLLPGTLGTALPSTRNKPQPPIY